MDTSSTPRHSCAARTKVIGLTFAAVFAIIAEIRWAVRKDGVGVSEFRGVGVGKEHPDTLTLQIPLLLAVTAAIFSPALPIPCTGGGMADTHV